MWAESACGYFADEKGCALDALTLADMQKICPAITDEVFSVLGVDESVASRTSAGGTAPANVRQAVARARQRFL